MNCSQVRALLATYRELENDQAKMTACEVHLKECTACRQIFAQHKRVGEHIRSLPHIEPLPDAHTKLMQTLAVEHSRFIQRTSASATSLPTPAFLLPYLENRAKSTYRPEALIAFSTADTGPLPVLRTLRQHHHPHRMSQFAILGLAATFLMVLLMGGLTSLLLLANRGLPGSGNSASVVTFAQVAIAKYSTTTPYPHVVSAIANRGTIYYTAYGESTASWMLERLDPQTKLSTPLLSVVSTSTLIVLGSTQNWLVWLQLDRPKPIGGKHLISQATVNPPRTWSLNALSLEADPSTNTPITLLKDTFDLTTIPAWVHTPVQGIWFLQNTLLAATVDSKGASHLSSYQLGVTQDSTPKQLATTTAGHIITSPTANSDGTSIYWSDEWLENDATLHSNIWTQQTTEIQPPYQGRWVAHTITSQSLFRADKTSFHPQVVDHTLFFIKADPSQTQTTPEASAIVAPTATPSISQATSTAFTTRIDPSISVSQIDETIQGTILAFSANGAIALPTPQDTNGSVTAIQGGSRFLLWQNSTRGFEMYDVIAKYHVSIGSDTIARDATFLAVNGDTAVWVVNPDSVIDPANLANSTVTFSTFNWPAAKPQPVSQKVPK